MGGLIPGHKMKAIEAEVKRVGTFVGASVLVAMVSGIDLVLKEGRVGSTESDGRNAPKKICQLIWSLQAHWD